MLDLLSSEPQPLDIRRDRPRRLRRARRAGGWLLLTGWIVLPLLPALAFGLSKLLGLEF